MRFLVDNALPPRLARLLAEAGYDATHVRDYGIQSANDDLVLARALLEDRIVVSADTDFGTLLAGMEASRPSFILFRDSEFVTAEDFATILLRNLATLRPDLESGCVAVFRAGRLRVRKLPIAPAVPSERNTAVDPSQQMCYAVHNERRALTVLFRAKMGT